MLTPLEMESCSSYPVTVWQTRNYLRGLREGKRQIDLGSSAETSEVLHQGNEVEQ